MSSQREMSGEFPEMEDILRSASAEGSFGAGKLNEQRRSGQNLFLKEAALAEVNFAVSFHAIPALQERDVCVFGT